MASRKPQVTKQPLLIRTHTLTQETNHFLQQLSQEASDTLGWKASHSAIIRALLVYTAQQPPSWVATNLFPLIEQEIADGTFWGRKKR